MKELEHCSGDYIFPLPISAALVRYIGSGIALCQKAGRVNQAGL